MKKIQINGKIFHGHGLEESILLKCPHYPKQSTDSMQSLSNFQWHFSHRNITGNPKIVMETQKTPSSQHNTEKEQQSWQHHALWFQIILQIYGN